MKLIIPAEIQTKIAAALTRAGRTEIGGILMGEHVADGVFRIGELTVQRGGGTFATFVRLVESFVGPLRAFFERTKRDYTRFNYLGEWHSHHSFALVPSGTDRATMRDLVSDPKVGGCTLRGTKVDPSHALRNATCGSPPAERKRAENKENKEGCETSCQ